MEKVDFDQFPVENSKLFIFWWVFKFKIGFKISNSLLCKFFPKLIFWTKNGGLEQCDVPDQFLDGLNLAHPDGVAYRKISRLRLKPSFLGQPGINQ